MLKVKTREGKDFCLAELCWFEEGETPLLRVAEGQYLATKKGRDEKYPTISYILIDIEGNTQKEEWSVLPVWVPELIKKPKKVYPVKVNPEEIERVYAEAISKVIEELEAEDEGKEN